MRRAKHSERGASMAETAIVMSVVLLLMFGIIDFARMTYTYSFLANSARMGARWMMVRGSQSCTSGNGVQIDNCNAQQAALQTYIRSLNNGALNSNSINVGTPTFTNCPGTLILNSPGCTVNVSVSYQFPFIAPYFSRLGMLMSSTSKMVISQ